MTEKKPRKPRARKKKVTENVENVTKNIVETKDEMEKIIENTTEEDFVAEEFSIPEFFENETIIEEHTFTLEEKAEQIMKSDLEIKDILKEWNIDKFYILDSKLNTIIEDNFTSKTSKLLFEKPIKVVIQNDKIGLVVKDKPIPKNFLYALAVGTVMFSLAFYLWGMNTSKKPTKKPIDTPIEVQKEDKKEAKKEKRVLKFKELEIGGIVKTLDLLEDSKGVTASPMSIDTDKVGKYTVVYEFDGEKVEKTFVIEDMTAPIIKVKHNQFNLARDEKVDIGAMLKGLSVTDNGEPMSKGTGDGYYSISNDIEEGNPGKYRIVITAIDKAGNKSTKTIVVNITNETLEKLCKIKVIDREGKPKVEESVWVVDKEAKPYKEEKVWVVDVPKQDEITEEQCNEVNGVQECEIVVIQPSVAEQGHYEINVIQEAEAEEGHYETKVLQEEVSEISHYEEKPCPIN